VRECCTQARAALLCISERHSKMPDRGSGPVAAWMPSWAEFSARRAPPEALTLGRYDLQGRLRVIGRTHPLRPDARAELASLLAEPCGPHPWPTVIAGGRLGLPGSEPVIHTGGPDCRGRDRYRCPGDRPDPPRRPISTDPRQAATARPVPLAGLRPAPAERIGIRYRDRPQSIHCLPPVSPPMLCAASELDRLAVRPAASSR
jgi:hypothetical protein